MWKYCFFLFIFALSAQELEVRLATRSPLKPIYLSSFGEGFEEFRDILQFDLNVSGFCFVLQPRDDLEESLRRPPFDLPFWKKEKIPFCLVASILQNRLELTALNTEDGTCKKYSSTPLERRAIHRLADALQKDLFGKMGIASLHLIYTQRTKIGEHKWRSEIWISDFDGANARQVTAENSYCLSPFFFPNTAEEFFYVSEKTGQSKIYRASLANPEGQLMVDLRGNQALASLSKKGGQIAFITDAAGRPDLFVQNLDEKGYAVGKPRQLFSAPRATQATPTYSPDGKQIAFVSDKDGPPRIYVIDATSSNARPRLLTKRNRENTSPAWSPDGTKLAYSAKIDGVRQIWIYDFLTEEEIPLTTGPENKENPSWAPDSFHLVYNTESPENCELYLIHLNGGEPVPITKGRFASWELRQ